MTHTIVGWSTLAASVFGAPVEWLKNALLFHPRVGIEVTPAAYGLAYEDVRFGEGSLVHGWYVRGPGDLLFVWFHGNAGNIQDRLEHVGLMREHVGGSHVVFDYQGYGWSRGRPSIPGILSDGRAVLDTVYERGWAREKRMVFHGESLGAAVAVALAAEMQATRKGTRQDSDPRAPDRLILEAPFYSLHAMARRVLPPLAFLVKGELDSARFLAELDVPKLILHGTRDQTVPFAQGRALYEAAAPPKRFSPVPAGGHVGLYEVAGHAYFETIADFVADPRPDRAASR